MVYMEIPRSEGKGYCFQDIGMFHVTTRKWYIGIVAQDLRIQLMREVSTISPNNRCISFDFI